MTPSGLVPLHGWLEQGDVDPFVGRPAVDAVLKEALGLDDLRATPAAGFNPDLARPTRLLPAALASLRSVTGEGAVDLDPERRARASVGQGYLDVLARRAGRIDGLVDAVVSPRQHDEALAVLRWCQGQGVKAQLTGGATGVVGGFDAAGDPVRIALSTARLCRVLSISPTDLTARAEAGLQLADLDAALADHGLMLGHQPQSYHGVTLGGAIAAHGAGQRSNGFGRMSDLLVAARLATPIGTWDTEPLREAASGPWLGGLVTGSEGAFGLITEATVRVAPRLPVSAEIGFLFGRFDDAVGAARALVQSGVPLSMVRVSDAEETTILGRFARARRDPKPSDWWIDQWLKWRGAPASPSLLLIGVDADRATARAVFAEAQKAAREAINLGAAAGRSWRRGRFEAPYWREGLMNRGLGVETLETALPWSSLVLGHQTIKATLSDALAATLPAGRPIVFCHVSHAYREAASLYFTMVFPRDLENPQAQWRAVKAAGNAVLARLGAAPSHHHGMGSEHADLLPSAKDPTTRALLSALRRTLDPTGLLIAPGFERL